MRHIDDVREREIVGPQRLRRLGGYGDYEQGNFLSRKTKKHHGHLRTRSPRKQGKQDLPIGPNWYWIRSTPIAK